MDNRAKEEYNKINMDKLRELTMAQQWEITKGHMRAMVGLAGQNYNCLLYTSPSPRDS